MFELEVDFQQLSVSDIPDEVIQAFEQNASHFSDIAMLALLQWEEHCTECAMPDCYKTCDHYEPRKDGKCRRFSHGIIPFYSIGSRVQPVVKIDFKRWGSLMATNQLSLLGQNKVIAIEQSVRKVENLARSIPDRHLSILGRRGLSSRLVTRYKNRMTRRANSSEAVDAKPTGFMIEVFNPATETADVTFVIRAKEGDKNPYPYQKRLLLEHGYSRIVVEYSDIQPHIDKEGEHYVSITPNIDNHADKGISLYFGTLGLFRYRPDISDAPEKKVVKVVAWDLDNTVWDGILVEDGADCIRIKSGIEAVIKELDRRGIVNSVLSKNDHGAAWEQLEKYRLSEYFLFPQINWSPKSQGMGELIASFNVGEDAIVFIDDSAFERAEVAARYPQVRTLDAQEYQDILGMPEFNPEVSTESSRRREFYRNQNSRISGLSSYSGEYLDFVRNSRIKLTIAHGHLLNLERIHELVQRTNQMNFSGNRYTKEQLRDLLANNSLETFSMHCEDCFGDYGTVGFCVVDKSANKLIDLTFSCRVQSKRVEHAFLGWLLERYNQEGVKQFNACYQKTGKNEQAGRVFSDLGFEVKFMRDDIIEYWYPYNKGLVREDLIEIIFESQSCV